MALDFPNSPTTGSIYTSGGQSWMWDGAKWTNVSGLVAPAGRNFIHNPYFNIQQRGTGAFNISASGSNVYTADRWFGGAVTDTASVTLVALADADRAAIGDEAAKQTPQIVFTGSSTASSYTQYAQRVEDVRRLSGKQVTVSFWARATSGTPRIGASYIQVLGSGGSPSSGSAANFGVTPALSTTWQRYSFSGTIASAAGKTFGTTANTDFTQIEFWLSDQGAYASRSGGIGVQSGTVQFWGMQLELGNVATPLEKIDPRYDLANCLRFYQVWSPPPIRGGAAASGASVSRMGMPLPVPMRAAPTVTLVSALPVYNAGQTNTITSFSQNYSNTQTLEIDGVVSGTWSATVPTPTMVYLGAGGSVTVSADL